MVGVLHTWTRDLRYHPHVHDIVTGGGLAGMGGGGPPVQTSWSMCKPLSVLFRAKFQAQLQKTPLFPLVDAQVWHKDWVVHCAPVGSGQAAFRYLAPYIFRVAISHNRILQLEESNVTFQYKESATAQTRYCRVSAEECIRRFLQHVLPDRFVTVRYYGLLSPGNRQLLTPGQRAARSRYDRPHSRRASAQGQSTSGTPRTRGRSPLSHGAGAPCSSYKPSGPRGDGHRELA